MNPSGGEGAEVVYALRNDSTLARNVLESIGEEGQKMRKYYQRRLPEDTSKDYYFIHRLTGQTQPLLIEYGFIDNPADLKKLQNNLLDYGEAVVRAVANYIGVPYTPPGGSSGGTAPNSYIVQRGDSLYSIANRFGVTVDELKRANNLTSNLLTVGQVLTIPGNTEEPTPPGTGNYIVYTVKSGDTLYKIANQFGVSVDEIIRANNLTNTTLQIGDVLIIPSTSQTPEVPVEPTPPVSNNIEYVVKSGDSLYSIAKKYGVTASELQRYNNLPSTLLSIGQVLLIPTTGSYITYTVKRGDSLYNIARDYNTTVDEIKRINGLTSNLLSIGQTLMLPA